MPTPPTAKGSKIFPRASLWTGSAEQQSKILWDMWGNRGQECHMEPGPRG